MKVIEDFAEELGSKISFGDNNIINKNGRVFLVNKKLYEYTKKNLLYAGLYLGNIKKGKICPSFILLSILKKNKANKVIIDNKAAWLFICGRDIFSKRILRIEGSSKKGSKTLILNNFGDCLGFGEILFDLEKKSKHNKVIIKNLLDIGDFLRREN